LYWTELKIVDLSSNSEEEISTYPTTEHSLFPLEAQQSVRKIIADVRERGDAALLEHTLRYDNVNLTTSHIKLSEEELESCIAGRPGEQTAEELGAAIDAAIGRVREFHKREVYEDWIYRDGFGNRLGRKWIPVERVGIYIPGGKASYPSTLIMSAIPALVAGVREIAVVSPPSSFIPPSVLALTIKKLGGILDIYRIGGVQSIAALAFGTNSVKRVDKIVGPGNIYVTLAKKELYGQVDIDMLAGPSEVLIIADGAVDPKLTAADLLAQAEHDEEARALCITTSMGHALAVQREVKDLLETSKRRSIIEASLKNQGRIYAVKNMRCALALANRVAPEHLELHTENPDELLGEIKNAGAIFLGQFSPEALGDYIAGPSHVLPTGGTARFFSPLSTLSFLKFSSIIEITNRGFGELGKHASVLAEAEGLSSHARSVHLRKEE